MSRILELLTVAQNSHDADRFASYFSDNYHSVQPAHPDRTFTGRAQVLENWSSVFAGIPDFGPNS
jgi:SnoaL-like domain